MADVNRRQFLQTAAAATAAAPFVACGRAPRHRTSCSSSPTTCAGTAWACAGHPFLKTPNIDRLANEGVRFANAFCTSSLCSPSRASFLSGLYAHSHQVINNFTEFPTSFRATRARCTTPATTRPTSASGTWGRATTRSAPGSTTGRATRGRASTTTRASTSTASARSSRATTRTSSPTWRSTG